MFLQWRFSRRSFPGNRCSCSALLLVFGLFLPSCEMINPEEENPAYLRIDSIGLTTYYDSSGTSSHRISDAWVYMNDDLIGAFELPAVVPVLGTGVQKISVRAGIMDNGIVSPPDARRVAYQFYQPYQINMDLVKDRVIPVQPVVRYYPSPPVLFPWMEDFEKPGMTFLKSGASDTSMIHDNSQAFEGSKCGLIYLDASRDFFEATSTGKFTLSAGRTAYLELNYKSNNSFVIGIIAHKPSQSVQQQAWIANPTSGVWKKNYINLSNIVNQHADAINFNIFIGVIKDENVSVAEIRVDNIKLVTH